ncbi:MAG: hypothetical protein M3Y03_01225, partial [Verrucomicrobiota bacterium]|nr:hypothetical protein [Verrucomicrobiota bacterium]
MRSKTLIVCILPLLLLFSDGSNNSAAPLPSASAQPDNGTLEKMIVASGEVSFALDLDLLNGRSAAKEARLETLRFQAEPNSFFPVLVFNNLLRGPMLGSIALVPQNSVNLPPSLRDAVGHLVIEKVAPDQPYDLVVRDGKTGFVFFNIDRNLYEYDASARALRISNGRLLISDTLAANLGRPADAGSVVGSIAISAIMYPIEREVVANGNLESATLPPSPEARTWNPEVFSSGPDVIVGDLPSMQQFGSSGTTVGLGVGTTSCNAGDVELDWFALPSVDHPVIPQNLYRLSGGATNDARMEQIGQSWLKHAFTALQQNTCSFGCSSAANGTHLGVGCSDPYTASLNSTQTGLGSRAWVNPFTGAYPSTARDHTGHTHTGSSHRVIVEASDLSTTQNPGATYYAEAQYVTPHEYAWCHDPNPTHAGQCNMYNNVSYRRFNISGTTSFTFTAVGNT